MSFVVDASVVAAWAIAHESDDQTEQLFVRVQKEGALAPHLLWFEIRNVLVIAERRKRIAPRDAEEFLTRLDRLPLTHAESQGSHEVMRLARVHSLTAYDASYLELALREHVALATFDRKLAAAAASEGVPVLLA